MNLSNVKNIFRKCLKRPSRSFVKFVLVLFFGVLGAFLVMPWFLLDSYKQEIYVEDAEIPYYEAAIVFGAGLKSDGSPSDALKDRLDTAADLYFGGSVGKILVSGDNRVEDYNEPDNMMAYLIEERELPEDAVVPDYAGRRTYDTCMRAKEIWGLENALLISQGYHLSRAIFTCEVLGMDVEGVSATRQEYVYSANYKVREVLAIYKAVLDVYILHPDYIGGEHEDDFDALTDPETI